MDRRFVPKSGSQNSAPKTDPKFVPKNGPQNLSPKTDPKIRPQKRIQKFIPKNEPLVGMYLWHPPYGTMQVRSRALWYHYISKKTWFQQPCKHNGSYRGNISFVCSTEGYLWHNASKAQRAVVPSTWIYTEWIP